MTRLRAVLSAILVTCLRGGGAVKLPTGGSQQFLTEPASTTVREGGELVLACSVTGRVGELQWTRDDFGLGTEAELLGYSRYAMQGEDLYIRNISLAEDDARFQCQVGATETSPPLRSRYATVRVLAVPQPPIITAGPRMLVRAGRKALVQCISKGGRPAAQIRWRRDGQLVSEGVEEKVETLEDGKRTMTVSTLTFLASRNLSDTFLECEASSEAEGKTERKVGTNLEVEYEPQVQLVADKKAVFEGDMVRLSCKVDARPELVEYQWMAGGEEVVEARGAGELLVEAQRERSGQTVTCQARNKLGQGSADYVLDIQYAPVFVKTPQDVIGETGQRVQLECQVDSNPPATYTWTRSTATSETVGLGPLLSFNLSNMTVGLYTCTVASPTALSPVSRSARMSLRGPPTILPGRELQFGALGAAVRLLCEAEATPAVESFMWTFKGEQVMGGRDYSLLETQHGAMVRSSLLVTRLTDQQLGEYSCIVTNALGHVSSTVILRPVDGLPLLIMVAAAIGGLLLTLVLIVVVVTCRRMAQAPSKSSDKQPPQLDQLSNSSSQGTKAATLSTISAPDDLDGSDSLPEYHANYMKTAYQHQHPGYKSQPDLVPSHSALEPGWHGYGINRDLYASGAEYSTSGAGLHSGADYGTSGEGDGYNYSYSSNYRHYSSPSNTESPVQAGVYSTQSGEGYGNAGYGLLVGQYPSVQASGKAGEYMGKAGKVGEYQVSGPEDLNESSIGTHV